MFVEKKDGDIVNLAAFAQVGISKTRPTRLVAATIGADGKVVDLVFNRGTPEDCQEHLAGIRAAMAAGQTFYSLKD